MRHGRFLLVGILVVSACGGSGTGGKGGRGGTSASGGVTGGGGEGGTSGNAGATGGGAGTGGMSGAAGSAGGSSGGGAAGTGGGGTGGVGGTGGASGVGGSAGGGSARRVGQRRRGNRRPRRSSARRNRRRRGGNRRQKRNQRHRWSERRRRYWRFGRQHRDGRHRRCVHDVGERDRLRSSWNASSLQRQRLRADDALTAIHRGVTCDRCGLLFGRAGRRTTSDAQGKFKLEGIPAGVNVPLVFQIGKWRRQVTVPERRRLHGHCAHRREPDAPAARFERRTHSADCDHHRKRRRAGMLRAANRHRRHRVHQRRGRRPRPSL